MQGVDLEINLAKVGVSSAGQGLSRGSGALTFYRCRRNLREVRHQP